MCLSYGCLATRVHVHTRPPDSSIGRLCLTVAGFLPPSQKHHPLAAAPPGPRYTGCSLSPPPLPHLLLQHPQPSEETSRIASAAALASSSAGGAAAAAGNASSLLSAQLAVAASSADDVPHDDRGGRALAAMNVGIVVNRLLLCRSTAQTHAGTNVDWVSVCLVLHAQH